MLRLAEWLAGLSLTMMRIRPDPANWTGALCGARPDGWLRLVAGLVVSAMVLLRPAYAQQAMAASTIAGVTFPVPAQIWFPDPQRTQSAAINDLANRLDRSCAGTEFQIWDVAGDAAAEQLRIATDVAFTEAGWTFEIVQAEDNGARGYLARRGAEELILAWLRPLTGQIGLALCIVEVEAAPLDEGAGGAIRIAEITAEDGTPLPRPRPDPNGIPIEPLPSLLVGAIPADPAQLAPAAGNQAMPPPGLVVGQAAEPPPAPVTTAPEGNTQSGPARGDGPAIGLLLLSVGLAFGAIVLVRWGLGSMRERSVARWPTAIATVVYSQVASEDRRDRKGREQVRYVPVIAYEYAVEGAVYQAARLRFGDTAVPDLSRARTIAERFPVGAGIEVHYNPSRPGEATIEPGSDRIDIGLVAGIALGVLALASLINAVV